MIEIDLRQDDILSHACLEYIAQLLRAFAGRISRNEGFSYTLSY